jgi:hypothetical protein
MPTQCAERAPVPPPSYHRLQARLGSSLHSNALTLMRTLHPAFVVPLGQAGGALALSPTLAQRPRRFPTHLS